MSRSLIVMLLLAGGLRASSQEGFIVEFDSVQGQFAAGGSSVREVQSGYLVFGQQVSSDGTGQTRCMAYYLGNQGEYVERVEWDTGSIYDYGFGYIDPIGTRSDTSFASAVSRFNGPQRLLLFYQFDIGGELFAVDTLIIDDPADSIAVPCRATRATADGGWIVTGFRYVGSGDSKALLLKVDADANVEWWQDWGMPGILYNGYGVEQYVDGGYVVTGYRLGGGVSDRGWLRRTDSLGNAIWTRYYGEYAANGEAVRVAPDGSIFTWSEYSEQPVPDYGQTMLRKWTPTGGLVWDTRTHYFQNTRARDFELLDDGNIITCGGQSTFSFIAKYSSEGDSLWSRYLTVFDIWAFHDLFDITPTSDGGFVLTGNVIQAEADPTPSLQTLWVIKTDSLGCVIPGCQNVGVQEYVMDLQSRLQVSPNPASDRVSVLLELPEGGEVQGQAQVQLLDGAGRLVREQPMQQNFNQVRGALDVSALPAGTYYLHLRDAKRWLAGSKIIVQ